MKIGLLVIATGKYIQFVEQFRDSVEKYFFKNTPTQVTIFVFTDSPTVPDRTIKLYKRHQKFPYPTLTRYRTFCRYRKTLSQMDYLFYCDVDMKFTAPVGREILGDLVATLHPGYYLRSRPELPYETRRESLAHVPPSRGDKYYCGGFQGGRSKNYLRLCAVLGRHINQDLRRGIVAIVHDESHFNKYFISHKPSIVLTPDYCFPEELSVEFRHSHPQIKTDFYQWFPASIREFANKPKLAALYKDHEALRFSGVEFFYRLLERKLIFYLVQIRNRLRNFFYLVYQTQFRFARYFPEFWLYNFYRQKLNDVDHFNCRQVKLETNTLDIVTIAFNNPLIIELQANLLLRNLKDKFIYTVADNSTDPAASLEIRKICQRRHLGYVLLPKNPLSRPKLESFSHGCAMTWIYRNYLIKRETQYFGFLDHDMFPINNTSITRFLKNFPVYGLLQERKGKWYLWAGFCFFNRSLLPSTELEFLPGYGLDTGGGNWRKIYSLINKNGLEKVAHRYAEVRGSKIKSVTSRKIATLLQTDRLLEFVGDWLHTFNASDWRKTGNKNQQIGELLQKMTNNL